MIEVQGGQASGPQRVMPPGITPFENQVPRGKGFRTSQRGALHPVESSIQDMPSLPWNSSPIFSFPSFCGFFAVRDECLVLFRDGGEKNFEKGVDSRFVNPYCCAPHVVWGRAFGRRSGTEKCLTEGSECPRLSSPPRDEAL